MAVELTATTAQTVAAGANVLFTDTPVGCNRGYVVHREGAGITTLRGICTGCSRFARYRVAYYGNISIPTGGTVEAISIALDHLFPDTSRSADPPVQMYSMASAPSDSEYVHAAMEAGIDRTLKVLDEHMECIRAIYPKEYAAIMRMLKD